MEWVNDMGESLNKLVSEWCRGVGYVPFTYRDGYYVVELREGGSRGAQYMLVWDGHVFRHIGSLEGVKREVVAKRRSYRDVVYKIPAELLGRWIVVVDFSRSGNAFIQLCVKEEEVKCYLCEIGAAKQLINSIALYGCEKSWVNYYKTLIPLLVGDIEHVRKSFGAEILTKARRLEEILHDYDLALFNTLVLDTCQGRVLSLQKKISEVVELWSLAQVIMAVNGGPVPGDERSRYWYLEATTNVPATVFTACGKEFTLFYQPSIYPHIARLAARLIPGVGQEIAEDVVDGRWHLVPDVVVFEGRVDTRGYGTLHELAERSPPLLVVEAKTGLESVEWETAKYVEEQIAAYNKYLRPKTLLLFTAWGRVGIRPNLQNLKVVEYALNNKAELHKSIREALC